MTVPAVATKVGAAGESRLAGPINFRVLLGEPEWLRLPAAVRARFSIDAGRTPHAYDGAMTVEASLAGAVFAHLCRLIGTPLAPFTGDAVPVRVDVRPTPGGALVWDRTYRFPGRKPLCVSSAKVMGADGRLMEIVRGGLGMTLRLVVAGGGLHFHSTGYFLQLRGWRLPIPVLLTPGHAHVSHEDQGGGIFRFTLRFTHPVLGRTIFQTGLFHEGDQT